MPITIASQHKPRSGIVQHDLTLASVIDDLECYFSDAHTNWVNPDEPLLLALWSVHTHLIRVYELRTNHTPFLNVVSRDPDSGKTALAHALARVVPGNGRTRSSSIAQIKRFLSNAEDNRVLILEQFHNFGNARLHADRETLKSLLCLGFEPGTYQDDTLPNGQPVSYDLYCPKAFFGLASFTLEPEVRSRCIQIMLRQSTKQQESELWERYDRNPLPERGAKIKTDIEAWLNEDRANALNKIIVRLGKVIALNPGHGELIRREADCWRILFALADMAGPDYGKRIRDIAARMTISHSTDEDEADTTEAEQFDQKILELARTGRLPIDNWIPVFNGKRQSPVSDHPGIQVRAIDLGYPRDSRYGQKDRLPVIALQTDDSARTAELRIKVSDLKPILAALGTSRSDLVSAYRNAKRLHSQTGKDTMPLAPFKGHKEAAVLAITFSSVIYGRDAK